jgi:hypothetical protein
MDSGRSNRRPVISFRDRCQSRRKLIAFSVAHDGWLHGLDSAFRDFFFTDDEALVGLEFHLRSGYIMCRTPLRRFVIRRMQKV